MRKLTVGMQLFSLNTGNAARNKARVLTPVIVTKIGRKFFYAKKDGANFDTRYLISNWREDTDYSVCSVLFQSEQDYEDMKHCKDLSAKIYNEFKHGGSASNLDLCSLKQIHKIIEDWRLSCAK